MSVIVAVRKGQRTVIAADTLITKGSTLLEVDNNLHAEKIFKHRQSYVGVTGWCATSDVFESLVSRHGDKLSFTNRKAIFESFRKMHSILKKEYFINPEEDKEQPVESSQIDALIVNPNGLFELESYRAVHEYKKYWAIGSGSRYALGAIHALYDQVSSPLEIAKAGVEAACALNDGCGLPMTYYTVKMRARSRK